MFSAKSDNRWFHSWKCFGYVPGLILGQCPPNEKWCYIVTTSLIGPAQTYNQPWVLCDHYLSPEQKISQDIEDVLIHKILHAPNDSLVNKHIEVEQNRSHFAEEKVSFD